MPAWNNYDKQSIDWISRASGFWRRLLCHSRLAVLQLFDWIQELFCSFVSSVVIHTHIYQLISLFVCPQYFKLYMVTCPSDGDSRLSRTRPEKPAWKHLVCGWSGFLSCLTGTFLQCISNLSEVLLRQETWFVNVKILKLKQDLKQNSYFSLWSWKVSRYQSLLSAETSSDSESNLKSPGFKEPCDDCKCCSEMRERVDNLKRW